MRTLYHEFESLEHLLATRLLPGGEDQPIRFVVFGGTGAVGGASVMELCRLILMTRGGDRELSGEIYATGLGDKEIAGFVRRLYMALDDEVTIEKIEPLRHYRLDGRIDLRFDLLRLEIPADLADHVAAQQDELGETFSVEAVLHEYFGRQNCAFLNFVEALDDSETLHAVLVAIPLPSVATYTLGTIDDIVRKYDLDHRTGQRIKKRYLQTFVRGLAVIHQRYARHVVMAHTTAVGGMYRVDGGTAEIRLGFAHSSLGKLLVDKKFFADELTQLFIDQGFDVLVTAAAIGIDAVEFRCPLPASGAIVNRLRKLLDAQDHVSIAADDLDRGHILLYRFHDIPLVPPEPSQEAPAEEEPAEAAGEPSEEAAPERIESEEGDLDDDEPIDREALRAEAMAKHFPDPVRKPWPRPLAFGAGKDLTVDAAIRSGENGIFSVANCVALYNVMKVAIPEELAMVLVRHALFGPERRRDWFHDKVCYYTETENSLFALRLLDSYPQLARAHHGPFSIQAYQALGSSTHQARLHELGLLLLVLRLRELRGKFSRIPEKDLEAALGDLDGFLWKNTRIPAFQDLEGLDADTLALEMRRLVQADDMEGAGAMLGYDPKHHAVRQPGREKFLHRLATQIQRYLQCITSLGVPIIYRDGDGEDRVLVGPYVAPMDDAIANSDGLVLRWQRAAVKWETDYEPFRDWVICNSGFLDLRPHAIGTNAKEPGAHLEDRVWRMKDAAELEAWLASLPRDSYFTTGGLVALVYRLGLLGEKVMGRKVRLGTRETWKHLFQQDEDGRHQISPGLVETVRMYTEGLGKITGTEALWPRWGY